MSWLSSLGEGLLSIGNLVAGGSSSSDSKDTKDTKDTKSSSKQPSYLNDLFGDNADTVRGILGLTKLGYGIAKPYIDRKVTEVPEIKNATQISDAVKNNPYNQRYLGGYGFLDGTAPSYKGPSAFQRAYPQMVNNASAFLDSLLTAKKDPEPTSASGVATGALNKDWEQSVKDKIDLHMQGVRTNADGTVGYGNDEYDAIIEKAIAENPAPGLDKDFVKSIINAESGFNPSRISNKGASGIMQLMPGTAKEMGVKDIWNTSENIYGGVKYISKYLRKYNGDKALALSAYNAGDGNVQKYGGVPPFEETRTYIDRINNTYNKTQGINGTAN